MKPGNNADDLLTQSQNKEKPNALKHVSGVELPFRRINVIVVAQRVTQEHSHHLDDDCPEPHPQPNTRLDEYTDNPSDSRDAVPHHDVAGADVHLRPAVDRPCECYLAQLSDEIWRNDREAPGSILERHGNAGCHEDPEEQHAQNGTARGLVLGDGAGGRKGGVGP